MLYLHLLRHQLIMNLFNIRLAQTRIIVSITQQDYQKVTRRHLSKFMWEHPTKLESTYSRLDK